MKIINKVKDYRTLRVLGRAENARPFCGEHQFTKMSFSQIALFVLTIFFSSSELYAKCKPSDEKTRLNEVIRWGDFECDKSGECGVIIKVPNLIEGAKFEELALIKGNNQKLEFLSRLPTEIEGKYSIAIVSGTEKFLKNFSVRALYSNGTPCLSSSDRPLVREAQIE